MTTGNAGAMLAHLDFPAEGFERASILAAAGETSVVWEELSDRERFIFIHAMSKGYTQGKRDQARATIYPFTLQVVGFRP